MSRRFARTTVTVGESKRWPAGGGRSISTQITFASWESWPRASCSVRAGCAINDAHERLQKIQDLLDVTLTHSSLDGLFGDLLVGVRDLLGADTCAILLLDEANNELVARAARGLVEEVERGVRIPVGKGYAGRIVASRRPLALNEVDHPNVLNPILREKGVKSLLGAPLMTRERVLGLIHAARCAHGSSPRRKPSFSCSWLSGSRSGSTECRCRKDLVRLDRTKSDFIAVASHELRNPVTVVRGIAATLHLRGRELDSHDDEEVRKTL